MRSIAAAAAFLLLVSASALPSELSPFSPAFLILTDNDAYANQTAPSLNKSESESDHDQEQNQNQFDLLKRQSNCPANSNSCSVIAAIDAGSCCAVGSVCTLDNVGNIACCPLGSFCTGTLTVTQAATTIAPVTTTSNGAIVVLSPTTVATTTTVNTALTTPTATATISYYSNAFFPFPAIATSYSNAAACTAAYSACATNYALCAADLQGGGSYAVTIQAVGGGITVAPTVTGRNLPATSASSICSSLSSAACPGDSGTCTVFGTGTTIGVTASTVTGFTIVTAASGVERGRGRAELGAVLAFVFVTVAVVGLV